MINLIIFSKNRACQLELLIRSMKIFFKEFSSFKINILYTHTNYEFEKGYDRLKEIHRDENLNYFKEIKDFQSSLLELFDKSKKYSVFFVDDNVFKEPFSLEDKEFQYFTKNLDVLTLSLRLHPRLSYCYPARVQNSTPTFIPNEEDIKVFHWKGLSGDFGYPMSLDGHFFRTSDIYYYLISIKYNGPNPLESFMASRHLPIPKMMCYDKSVIMNLPLNKVQTFNNNIHGNISEEYLNEQFLSGKCIDLEPIIGFENISCHQEIPINLIDQ